MIVHSERAHTLESAMEIALGIQGVYGEITIWLMKDFFIVFAFNRKENRHGR